jgi:hypothetical protein
LCPISEDEIRAPRREQQPLQIAQIAAAIGVAKV